jgi:hypothetical protein
VLLQPLHALGVQVVGGLVEQQEIGPRQQQPAQRDPAPLPAGQGGDRGVAGRQPQGVHGHVELGVQVPGARRVDRVLDRRVLVEQAVHLLGAGLAEALAQLLEPGQQGAGGGDTVLDVAEHVPGRVKGRLLVQDADRRPRGEGGLAVGDRLQAGHDLQHGRLAGPVGTDNADLGPGQEGQGHVVEDELVLVRLAHPLHHVDVLGHAGHSTSRRRMS